MIETENMLKKSKRNDKARNVCKEGEKLTLQQEELKGGRDLD